MRKDLSKSKVGVLFTVNKECRQGIRVPIHKSKSGSQTVRHSLRQWKPIMLQMCNSGRPWTSKNSRLRSCTLMVILYKCDVCIAVRPSLLDSQAALNGGCPVMAQQMSDHGSCNLQPGFDLQCQ